MVAYRLADLLAPADEDALAVHIRERRFWHLSGNGQPRWASLFSWDRLGELIARQQVQAADLRIFAHGRMLNREAAGIVDGAGDLRPLAIQALARQGASIAVSKIHGSSDALWALACDVERRLGNKVSITAIASFSSAPALPLHYDDRDLLILQVDGCKHWTFRGQPVAGSGISRPLKDQPTEVTGQVAMRPGDVLFVPSGLHHQCLPEGRSLHLAILIKRLTGQDVMDQLRARITDDPLFDTLIPSGQGADILAAFEQGLKARLHHLIDEISLAQFLAGHDAAQQGVTGLDLFGQRPTEGDAERLELLPRRRLVPTTGGNNVRVAGRSVPLSPALRQALEMMNQEGGMPIPALRAALVANHGETAAADALAALVDQGLARVRTGTGKMADGQ